LLCLQAHSEYPVKRCCHQRSPSTISQSLWLKHTLNIQWKGVTIKNHSKITCIRLGSFMYTMNVYWNCVAVRNHYSPPVWSTLFYTHSECPLKWSCHEGSPFTTVWSTLFYTHTHQVSTEMVLPSTVTDHSPSLTTVHFYTQWMVLEMAWHYQSPSSQHQPSTHNHAGNEHLRSVTRQEQDQLPYTSCQHPLPVHSEHNAGAVIAGSQQTNSPHGQLKDAVHSPTSVRTIPRFPIRASIIIDVKCNCTGSPHTNLHTPTPHERLHHPLLLNLGQYHQWCSAQLTDLLVKSTISGKSSAGYEYWCIRQTIITLSVPACL